MLNKTQLEYVVDQLRENGSITRNECLRMYISRLASIINILKNRGWEFEAADEEFVTPFGQKALDYRYTLIKEGQ